HDAGQRLGRGPHPGRRHAHAVDRGRDGGGGRQRDDERGLHGDAVGGGAGAGDGELRDERQLGGGARGLRGPDRDPDLRPRRDDPDHHGGGAGQLRGRVGRAVQRDPERRGERDAGQRLGRGPHPGQRHAHAVDPRRDAGGGRQRADERGLHGDAVGGGAGAGDGELHDERRFGGGAGRLHGADGAPDLRPRRDDPDHHGGRAGRFHGRVR